MAGTSPSRDTAPRVAAGDVAPQLLAAMKRDLGVDGDQARARLQRARWASGVSSTLAVKTGSDYAGAWLTDGGMTLKVAVTDRAAAKQVAAAGAQPVLVERSEQELDAAKEKLDAARSDAGDLVGWFVSAATNKVVVQAKKGDTESAWAFAKAAGLDRDDVAVETAAPAKPLADIRGGDPYIINGNARCSVGFSVEGGFVTAGHCGAEGADTASIQGAAQGEVADSVFPGSADMGFVRTDADENPLPLVNDFEGNLLPVAGNTEAPVGAPVCRSGSTTGTFCGVIQAKNQTVVYPEGAVSGLTQTDVCAEGGDSGGPWLSGDQAQGVTSGGSGDCTRGGITFFQPVNEILAANNLTLLTQGGQEPPAEEPPAEEPPADEPPADEPPADEPPADAAACPELPVQMQGSLSRPRLGQAQPSNGAFRARAGEQTACLQGPEGADFDLVLQRRTLRGFRTVAQATGDEAVKQLTFNGRAGTYRYVVVSSSGSGDYTLGVSTP
ncbi:S1 family peptidase [Actinoplanes sp. NPDC051633]|uniref:S1 family peptidase n=1 Tax=Actinoplanes sp. NPDC051633 TaxID=3155670 RepID=UPI00341B6D17